MRSRREEREALAALDGWLSDRDVGFIVGTVRCGTAVEGYTTRLAHVDCCPVSLVAIATELLEAASEKMRAVGHPDLVPLICAIEQATAALDFSTPESVS